MKKLLIWLLFLPTLIMADAVIFSGSDVKALKQNLDLFGVVKVMSGAVDPSTGGGVAAPVGSAYLSTVHGLFLKTGVGNTAWTKNALLPIDLTAQVTGILPTANGGTGSSNLGTGVVKASGGALSSSAVNLATEVTGTLPVGNGGTGTTSTPTNGQIPIGNGTTYQAASITGTANQVGVTNGAGSITLTTPQDIATTSNVQFANLNATGTTTLNSGLTGPLKASSGVVSSSAIDLTSEVSGTLPIANGGTGSATQNFVDLTTNQTIAGEKAFSNTLKSDSIQTTGSSGVVIKNSSGTTVADFGPANTTNVSIAGGLNTGGNIAATGTVTGSNLSGTNTGDLTTGGDNDTPATTATIVVPNKQLTLTGTNQYRNETGNLNELQNPNFEHTTVTTGWTISNATSSSSTTRIEGSKSLSLALTGALSLSQSSTINASQKSGVQMVASIWVNSSDISDLQLCSLKNGSEDKCTVTGGYVQGSGWRQLTISFIGNATSNGLKLKSTDTTGTVLVDSAFVGIGSPVVDFTPDNVYSAKIDSAGNVTDENTDFISGNCTLAGTNNYRKTCNFVSNLITVPMNCVAIGSQSNYIVTVTGSSTTFIQVDSSTNTGVAVAGGAVVHCQKQGADYKTSKAYVASSSDFGYTNTGTITITATTTNPTKGTIVTDRVLVSRKGQRLIAEYQYEHSSAGTAGSGSYLYTLPNGLSFDSSLVSFSTGSATSAATAKSVVGYGKISEGATASYNVQLIAYDATRFRVSTAYSGVPGAFQANGNYELASLVLGFNFKIDAPIQGWTDSGVIVGSFQGYNETPGTSRVETFSVSYGKTAATICDGTGLVNTNQCAYLDQIGNAVTSITRSGTGGYTLILNKTYSRLKCSSTLFGAANGSIANIQSCSNCSSLAFNAYKSTDGTAYDSYGTLFCQGIPQ